MKRAKKAEKDLLDSNKTATFATANQK